MLSPWLLSIRTQAEWKVLIQFGAAPITKSSTRWRISPAALLVKVTAKILPGLTPIDSSWAIR